MFHRRKRSICDSGPALINLFKYAVGLPPLEEVRQQATLSRIEESLCNAIARRVHVPDRLLFS